MENLELRTVARKLDGYSGADITNVCRDASMMSMRRKIAGLKPSEIRYNKQESLNTDINTLGGIFLR